MSNMTKNKKLIFITILCIALIQMPFLALTPAIARMSEFFSGRSLSQIQTAVALPSLVSMFSALVSAFLIAKCWISKKTAVIAGLWFAIATGCAAIFLHTEFWHLILFSSILGMALGFFIPTSASIMFDSFDEEERQVVTGYQTSFINIGGIVMSAVGGLLTTIIWYGGYLTFLLMVPVAILAAIALPGSKIRNGMKTENISKKKSKLPTEVFYYGGLIFLFMMIYNVGGNNLSTHLAEAGLGNSATAGLATAVQMAGGVASGLIYGKLSAKLRDYIIFFAFSAIFIGFTILNVGHSTLFLTFIGLFIVGSSLSLIMPQCMFAVSNCVDPSNSSTATTIIACVAPGAGAFLSSIVFTNLTSFIGGASTNFRYQFVGIVALLVGIAIALNTMRIEKNAQIAPLPISE